MHLVVHCYEHVFGVKHHTIQVYMISSQLTSSKLFAHLRSILFVLFAHLPPSRRIRVLHQPTDSPPIGVASSQHRDGDIPLNRNSPRHRDDDDRSTTLGGVENGLFSGIIKG